ncbi:hypothetical protein GCM10020358_21430 [Amorphoplanes nipponensis]|uniref:hypothetical protein n=1 Tax=Actinoplanes nipponensis TaxID=135950 RepID=UPI0031F0B524
MKPEQAAEQIAEEKKKAEREAGTQKKQWRNKVSGGKGHTEEGSRQSLEGRGQKERDKRKARQREQEKSSSNKGGE